VVGLAMDAWILPSLEQHITCASVVVWLYGHLDRLTTPAGNLLLQKFWFSLSLGR